MARLDATASVQLDANGNGTASVGPLSAREVWHPETVHVSVSSDASEAVCSIYVGDNTDQRNFRDSTNSGSFGDSTDRVSGSSVKSPHRVFAVWTGGDPHAYAVMTVTGSKDV